MQKKVAATFHAFIGVSHHFQFGLCTKEFVAISPIGKKTNLIAFLTAFSRIFSREKIEITAIKLVLTSLALAFARWFNGEWFSYL